MLQIDLTATSDGAHYVCFGLDSTELSNFGVQMWITKHGKRSVDWLQSLSLGFISFMGGDVWIHNQPESIVPRNNFFGEQKDMKVGIIANDTPNLVKLLDSIGIHTDGEWEVESLTIPKTLSYPSGMYSKIPKNRFKRREGMIRSEFLRNMKSSGSSDNTLDLLRGEPLHGNSAYLILKNTSTTEVRLYKVDINMTKSRI